MIHVGISALWALLILLTSIGWGRAALRICGLKHKFDWGMRSALGFSTLILIGGVLNLFYLISPGVILFLMLVGLALWWRGLIVEPRDPEPLAATENKHGLPQTLLWFAGKGLWLLALALLAVLLILPFLTEVYAPVNSQAFNLHDDFQAYFVFPKKMLSIGSIGPDPFNQRRAITSLGGQYFLHAFVLSVFDESRLHLLDHALAPILLFGMMYGLCRSMKVHANVALLAAILPIVASRPQVNISSVMTGAVLFLALFRLMQLREIWTETPGAANFLFALVSSSICTLKLNFIPPCVLFFFLNYLWLAKTESPRKALNLFLGASMLTAVFLLPWMLSLYGSSGTLLYPFLGQGYYSAEFDKAILPPKYTLALIFDHARDTALKFSILGLGVLAIVACIKPANPKFFRTSAVLVSAGAIVTMVGITLVMPDRYVFAIWVAAYAFLLSAALAPTKENCRACTFLLPLAVLLVILAFNGWGYATAYAQYQLACTDRDILKAHMENAPADDPEIQAIARMQEAVPPQATILARLDKPYLMNFKRNPIFVSDCPGICSLPPGMPIGKGPLPLVSYLLSCNIRYLAYAFKNEANFNRAEYGWRVNCGDMGIMLLSQYTFDFQENIAALAKTQDIIFQDADRYVLDLQTPRPCLNVSAPRADSFPASVSWADGASIPLTPGEWELTGVLQYIPNNSNSANTFYIGITNQPGNNGAGMIPGDNHTGCANAAGFALLTVPSYHVVLTSPEMFYLKVRADYTNGQPQYNCRISARRVVRN